MISPRDRADQFCRRFGLKVPLLMAPMAGACPPDLAVALLEAGSMGAMGAILSAPGAIRDWVASVRARTSGPFQLNPWIPDPAPRRDAEAEARVRAFLSAWGPDVPASAGDVRPPDFDAQCDTFLDLRPAVVSSIMGVFPAPYVARLKAAGIAWFATATTLAEAKAAEDAGADAVVAQGGEAGGHRGAFDAGRAQESATGLVALVPRLADHLSIPIIAAGGIGDGRAVAAALVLGASAAMLGTTLLRCPEAHTHPAWADALADLEPEQTMLTRAFSGLRAGYRHRLRQSRGGCRRTASGAVSGSTRIDVRNEEGRRGRRRPSPDAVLGRPVGGVRRACSGRRSPAGHLEHGGVVARFRERISW